MQKFKGEEGCCAIYKSGLKKGQQCTSGGYYLVGGDVFCGLHSDKKTRIELPVNPNKNAIKAQDNKSREDAVIAACAVNIKAKVRGDLICSKLGMRKEVPHVDGYQSVFPNRKHGNRADGIGYPSLSPMVMGPIKHGQPGLPDALNLENFWQSGKAFQSELDKNGKPGPEFYKTRREMYLDPEPQRHKAVKKLVPTLPSGEKNNVAFFVWTKKDGSEVYLNYIESRQVYCHFYTLHALKNKDFQELKGGLDAGLNINIIGYDGFDFRKAKGTTLKEKFEACYLDGSKPFGHELVLCALLLLKPDEWPWVKHTTLQF